jgi:DNA invertase Pin-like site-specific DNA recombinase
VSPAPQRKTAVYTRLSRLLPDQTSTKRQAKDCRRLAEARGWTNVAIYEDIASAFRDDAKRPDYLRLVADIEAGRIRAVAIWKIDRLGRNLIEFMRFVKLCEQHGVEVASVNDPFDTSTPIGRAIVQILAVFAELESATISLRVRNAKEHVAFSTGRSHGGGHRRFGYHRLGKDRLADDGSTLRCPTCGSDDIEGICTPEATLLREAANRIVAGETYSTIVREWNAAGVKTVSGRAWALRDLSQLLPSPHLAGLRVHKGDVVGDAAWTAILDRTTYEALKALAERHRRPAPRRRYLLSGGLVVCGREGCGKPLQPHQVHGKRNYWCVGGELGGGCGRILVLAEPVEDLVEKAILGALSDPAVVVALADAPSNANGDDKEALKQLRDAEKRLEDLGVDYGRGDVPRAAFLAAVAELESTIAALTRRLERAAERSSEIIIRPGVDYTAEWGRRDLTWRAALVAKVLEPVVILPATGGGKFREDRVRITPRA